MEIEDVGIDRTGANDDKYRLNVEENEDGRDLTDIRRP